MTGTGWIVGWRLATRLLGLVSTLVLARLLVPADFGLVALGFSFVATVEAMSSFGVDDALIREKAPTRALYDTGFTLGVLRALLAALVLAALAGPAAGFFAEPRLTPVLFALALGTLLEGFTNIGIVDFRRDFAFDKEFHLWILPRVASVAATIGLALALSSHWALIGGFMVQRVLRVAFSYRFHPFRPRFGLGAWRQLVGYSTWVWLLSMILLVRNRGPSLVIGRQLDPTAVGVFSVSSELAVLPTTELVEPLCRAAFPGFSEARHSGLDAGRIYLRFVASAMLLTWPLGIGISLVADPVVRLAFGPLWTDATPLIQIMGVAGCASVLGTVGSVLLRVYGLMRLTIGLSLAAVALQLVLLGTLTPLFGLWGTALAQALAAMGENLMYLVATFRRFGLSPRDLLAQVWRCLLATAAMAAVLAWSGLGWCTADGPPAALAVHLLAAVLAGGAVYTATVLATWLAAGRPAGPEADALLLLRRLARRLRAFRPPGPALPPVSRDAPRSSEA